MGRKSGSGPGMNNPDNFCKSLETIFFGLKILKFSCGSVIRDGKNSHPGSGMEKNWIRDKHPGSATMGTTSKP
jgi:hypothetical protein